MKNKPAKEWRDVEKSLGITAEQEVEIKLEMELIKAVIEARESKKITQRELSKISGIKQPAIARIEKGINSVQTSTLIKILHPMGYKLKVVPLEKSICSKNKK